MLVVRADDDPRISKDAKNNTVRHPRSHHEAGSGSGTAGFGFSSRPVVLHVTQPGSEGVANYVVGVCGELATEFDVAVAGPDRSDLFAGLETLPVSFHPWNAGRDPFDGLTANTRRLARILAEVRPDVVHLHSSKAGAVGRLLMRGRRPTVLQPHAWSFQSVGPIMATAALSWERTAARWTHALIAVSEDERDVAAANGIRGIGHVEVIANPVDTTRFRPRSGDEPHASGSPAGSSSPLADLIDLDRMVVAGCVGRLCHQKGQDILLSSVWPQVRARVPNAVLVLIGDGPDRNDLERRADESVVFLGNRPDVDALWPDVDVALFPSRWEGMSLAMLEAMASEVSVVASDVGGVAETVGRGAGAVVPLDDRDGWVGAIVTRLRSESVRAAEGRRGRELVITDHTPDSVAKRLAAIYHRLIGGASEADEIKSASRVVRR